MTEEKRRRAFIKNVCFCALLIIFLSGCTAENLARGMAGGMAGGTAGTSTADKTGEESPAAAEPEKLPEQHTEHPLSGYITEIFDKINLPAHKREYIINNLEEDAPFLTELFHILNGDPNLWVLVDKKNQLDAYFEPKDLVDIASGSKIITNRMLRKAAYEAVEEIINAAADEGHTLIVISAYRSYEHQGRTYTYWVAQEGQLEADRISARPGHSQHQLGFTVDFNILDNELAYTPEGVWLAENASRFGWSLSYPDGYEDLTGYNWECWHYRYTGKPLTAFINKYFDSIQQHALMFIHEFTSDLQITEVFSQIYGQS